MIFLKQSTAYTAKIGPFIDDTDGKTAETGLTISQADVRLTKNGGNIAQKNEATSCTHDELGYYDCPLDDTDTGTLGKLQLFVHESGALPVFHEFMVVPANVYDSLFSTDKLQVDVYEITNNAITAAAIATGAIDADALATDAVEEFVLGLLKYDWTGITGEAARSVLNALRAIRNKWSITGTTLTVTKEDDSTAAWTSTLTTSAGAEPITASDPAGP